MGVLKDLTKEYFGEILRKEDEINIDGIDVDIVTFTDKNGNVHRRGYKPKEIYSLKILLKRMIEVRGDEGDFNDIDTSEIESMSFLFTNKKTFNGDISGWDVSKVKSMTSMFDNATSFNQPIGKWDVSSVWNMNSMFESATSFDQDISNWNIKDVDVFNMFKNCPIKNKHKPKKK